ncbi:MAG: hypothetical protein WDA27_14630 [Actinomycetota bacterium]
MRNLFLTVAFLASIVALWACTKAQGDAALRVLTMSAEQCVKVAQANGRNDIATYCGLTDSALDILTASLADQTCTLPTDAGVE